MKKTIFFSIVFLCAAGVLAALILQRPFVQWRNAGGITVKGTSSERVKADAAVWTGTIEVMSDQEGNVYMDALKEMRADQSKIFENDENAIAWAAQRKAGYNKIQAQAQQAQALLIALGAKPEALEVSGALMRPVYRVDNGRQTEDVVGYRFTVTFRYTSSDADAVAALAKKSAELTAKGLAFTSNPPEFYYTKLEALKVKLLTQAAANARERAQALLTGGVQLGDVVSASQGVFQVTAPLSTEVSDWGCYDTTSIEKDVRCVVSMTYGTQP